MDVFLVDEGLPLEEQIEAIDAQHVRAVGSAQEAEKRCACVVSGGSARGSMRGPPDD
jgi:hypothetical protein